MRRAESHCGQTFGSLRAATVVAAVVAVPDRDAVPPPELAADAPVADVLHPVQVDPGPALGDEAQPPALDRRDRRHGERLHLHEPLQRQVRLDDGVAAVAAARPARGTARSSRAARRPRDRRRCAGAPRSGRGRRTAPPSALMRAVGRHDAQRRQSRGAGPSRSRWRRAPASPSPRRCRTSCRPARRRRPGIGRFTSGRIDLLADQIAVALVVRVHRHAGVAEHRLRPRRRHHHARPAVRSTG